MYRRNDISILVSTAGTVYLAQGNPALDSIDHIAMQTAEHLLYHSQLAHRAVWRRADGRVVIGYPRDVPADARAVVSGLQWHGRITGEAAKMGHV